MKQEIDAMDRKMISVLSEDGRLSAGNVAKRTGVTAPTVQSRLKNLISKGVFKIAGLVDPYRIKGMTIALVCITLKSHHQIDEKLDQISRLDKVSWAAVVTGRYDIMVEVVLSEEIADLYRFIDADLSKVGGINSSETFVLMNARNKRVVLPESVRRTYFDQQEEGK